MTPKRVVPLAIVSPVRDEAEYVRHTLDAMVAQSVQPQEWLFVDGASSDSAGYSSRHTRTGIWGFESSAATAGALAN